MRAKEGSGCSDRSSRFGPLNDAALNGIGHAVPSDDATHVLHAGHVTVRQRDAGRIAVLGGDHARQAAHPATQLQDSSAAADLTILQQIIGQAFLRRPNANVPGIVEADQFVGREVLL